LQKGIDPSHGQPGHRCDIAVGAPLNSKAATTAATRIQLQYLLPGTNRNYECKNYSNNNAPTVTAEGMNPPHGQMVIDVTWQLARQ
jgi:hypothetical protein